MVQKTNIGFPNVWIWADLGKAIQETYLRFYYNYSFNTSGGRLLIYEGIFYLVANVSVLTVY